MTFPQNSKAEFLKPGLLGKWIADRFDIWQMRFVSDSELGKVSQDRGLMSLSLGDHVKHLWHLGLLRADLIESTERVASQGLNLVDQDGEGIFYYSDDRQFAQDEAGIGGAIAQLPDFPPHLTLHFHPFRYYVLCRLDSILNLPIHPLQPLYSVERYLRLIERELSEFQQWSASLDFSQLINRWNDIVSLAVAAEPHTFTKVCGVRRHSSSSSDEEQLRMMERHWHEFREALSEIGLDKIEKAREDLCFEATMLDPNTQVHTILRLTVGEARLRIVKGRLGGAVILLAMAEMLRLSAEEAFSTQLREEDEIGHGPFLTEVLATGH